MTTRKKPARTKIARTKPGAETPSATRAMRQGALINAAIRFAEAIQVDAVASMVKAARRVVEVANGADAGTREMYARIAILELELARMDEGTR